MSLVLSNKEEYGTSLHREEGREHTWILKLINLADKIYTLH